MSTYVTVRGKLVSLGPVTFQVSDSGELAATVAGGGDSAAQQLVLSEAEASQFYDLMGDVMEYQSSHSTTVGQYKREEADIAGDHG